MEMHVTAETVLGQCYTAYARAARRSVRAPSLFTFFVVDCPTDSYTLEAKSNIA